MVSLKTLSPDEKRLQVLHDYIRTNSPILYQYLHNNFHETTLYAQAADSYRKKIEDAGDPQLLHLYEELKDAADNATDEEINAYYDDFLR